MTKSDLIQFRNREIEVAKIRGEKFFLNLPERWFEDPSWACENGHVSGNYLKCEEKGNVCLECGKPIVLIPPEIGEKRLAELLP